MANSVPGDWRDKQGDRWRVSMAYAPIAHGPLHGLDYHAARPFMSWQRPHLLVGIEEWLSLDPPRLELATLAMDELTARGISKAIRAHRLFQQAGIEPIPWLAKARAKVLCDLPVSTTPRGKGRIYVMLRGGYTAQSDHYGAYVGVTSKRVEDRLIEHRTGIRSGSGLKEHGIELLYSLFDWANPIPGGNIIRREHETRLHKILAEIVPRVSGDIIR